MDWQTKLNEPFFRNKTEVERYVTQELQVAVPQGWAFRHSEENLGWVIHKEGRALPEENFGLSVSAGLDLVVLTYGNSDAGAFNLSLVLQKALVIESSMLRAFPLRKCLQHLFEEKPNVWGLT